MTPRDYDAFGAPRGRLSAMSADRPQPAELFDRVADTYDQVGVAFFSIFGRRLVEISAVSPGERVLDVGCGRGAVTLPAAEAVGPTGHVSAIDLAPSMVERLRAELSARGVGHVDVLLMNAQQPDLPAETFDVVLSSLVVFFLPDPAAALAGYRRLLRPDGRFGMTTFGPDDERWRWIDDLREFSRDARAATPPKRELFESDDSVNALVSGAGFVDVTSRVQTHDIRFPGFDTWWTWSWSHGGRHFWESVPAERLDEARHRSHEEYAAISDEDGSAVMHQAIRYTTARRGALR
jgi:ubiquinone/menaquinone biosynthesis C-methylase UbiE